MARNKRAGKDIAVKKVVDHGMLLTPIVSIPGQKWHPVGLDTIVDKELSVSLAQVQVLCGHHNSAMGQTV